MFADATHDHQWIHVDPERAKSGPFGGTIAHGYLTMSLVPGVLHEVWKVEGMKMGLNYGINKLRFPSPVPVGSKVRADVTLASVEEVGGGGFQATLNVTMEIEGQDKPGCVAEVVYRYYG
jgi:acyl dehydratase